MINSDSEITAASPFTSPFRLDDTDAYRRWRDRKLDGYPTTAEDLLVSIFDPAAPSNDERQAIAERIAKANVALYAAPSPMDEATRNDPEDTVRQFGDRFGLRRLDIDSYSGDGGITPLRVNRDDPKERYIPYTDKPINWHTDGYYNPPHRRIRGFILFCVGDSAEGGDSALMDHEIAYILLRDEDPALIEALSHPDAMTIPANIKDGVEIRAVQDGPVFSVNSEDGALHMRYTARGRNVIWRDDGPTKDAVRFLEEITNADSPYIFRHRLMPGQGLICNNVLHRRDGFADDRDKQRLVYRARYLDRIAARDTGATRPPENHQ